MSENTNKDHLEELLKKLKRNLDYMPREQLKLQYRQGYQALCKDIGTAVEAYAKSIMFSDIRIHTDYIADAISITQKLLQSTAISRQLSKAAFIHQDLALITNLATDFHTRLQEALLPLYCSHIRLILTSECLEDKPTLPLIYSSVNHSILVHNTWIDIDNYHKYQKGENEYVNQ